MGKILNLIEGNMNGDAWEDLCVRCYRMKYQEQHYVAIPAVHKGDAGIEGYNFVFMDIEANILHLKEQKKMLAFALDNRQARKGQLEQEKLRLAADILTLRRLAQALRSDLYMTTDNDSSEAIVLRKIEISGKIEESKKLQKELDKFLLDLDDLSEQWQTYLAHKAKLPKHDKSDADVEKIRLLKSKFIENLKLI